MKLALLLAAILPAVALASSPTKGDLAVEKRAVTGVTGSAYGFATGTTGGGNVAGVRPVRYAHRSGKQADVLTLPSVVPLRRTPRRGPSSSSGWRTASRVSSCTSHG
jgi:hypothetical protein